MRRDNPPSSSPTIQTTEYLSTLQSPPNTTNSSPSPSSSPQPSPTITNDLSDIFATSPSPPTLTSNPSSHLLSSDVPSPSNPSKSTNPTNLAPFPNQTTHPSDIPRLRSIHSTNGYRDGISVSKAQHIQSGFDEGYSLGAVLGLRVGWILGVLEGILGALGTQPAVVAVVERGEGQGEGEVRRQQVRRQERERLSKMVKEARKELGIDEVFARKFFGEDGVWRFDVVGMQEGKEEGEGEVTFEHVVDSHPLLRAWMEVVQREVKMCGVDLTVLEGEGWEEGRGDDGG